MHNIDIPTDNESDMDWSGGKEIMGPSVTRPLVRPLGFLGVSIQVPFRYHGGEGYAAIGSLLHKL